MAALDYEILEEVFAKLLKEKDYQSLEVFMLSGDKPFQAGLNYLRRGKKVVISETMFQFEGSKLEKLVPIPYTFRLLNTFLDAIAYGLEEIIICRRPLQDYRDLVLGVLIEKYIRQRKLKKFIVWEPLAYKWYTVIRNHHGIEDLQIAYAKDLSGFAMISPTCRKLNLHYINFKTLNDIFIATHPSVEHILIDGAFELSDVVGSAIYDAFTFIGRTFPKLKSLKVDLLCPNYYLPDMYAMLANITPNFFEELPPNINGTISFKAKCQRRYFLYVVNNISTKNDIAVDYVDKSFGKEFMIQSGLSFKCLVTFD